MKNKVFIILIIILTLSIAGFFYFQKIEKERLKFRVTFFNVGQGDASLIYFGNGQKMLVDCGSDKKILSKLGDSLSFFDNTIDYLITTHPDLDHYGGCIDVLNRYKVKEIITNGRKKDYDPYWREWDEATKKEGAILTIINGSENWNIASTTINFLSPDPDLKLETKTDDSNNSSIVFKLTYNDETFLFTGDMEVPLEMALIGKYCSTTSTTLTVGAPRRNVGVPLQPQRDECILRSNILKVGHHGSDSSTSEEFLSYVRP